MAKKKKNKSVIELDQALPEIPDRKPWDIPNCYLEKDGKGGYKVNQGRRPSKTLLVNKIRTEVDEWRTKGYPGASTTSIFLLEYWFGKDHIIDREIFRFRFAQREAVETTIYLYEVKGIRDNALLAETYIEDDAFGDDLFTDRAISLEELKLTRKLRRINPANKKEVQQDLPPEDLTRYCAKAATGSGKTFVMAFLAVWSYFHRKFENNSTLADTILIIAPNVIVYERLKTDFANGKVFYQFPFIPDEWKHDWQMSFIMREDQVKTSTDGTLYLTNIHQIYENRLEDDDEDFGPVGNLLGSKPKKDSTASWLKSILERIMEHDNLLIINDEAHHVHDEELSWYKSIELLHENLKQKGKSGLSLLFDLTATPKDQNGTFFPWIISDYPLAQAIEDRIVKTPLIVRQTDKSSPDNKQISNAFNAYQEWIQIALKRYDEHQQAYGNLFQKPVLFIMCEDTKQADQVAEGIRKIAGFNLNDQVLVIHTNKDGTLSKNAKKLEELREQARLIDEPNSKVRVVVSVMMLREGWDVKNVSIILGLRPFTSKANILPEQSVGRGLRLMQNLGPDYTQILEIIGTDKFEEFVKQLEKEGVGVGVTKTPPKPGRLIVPLKTRSKYNFEIPELTPSFTRRMTGLDKFDVASLEQIIELDKSGNFRNIIVSLVHGTTEKTVGTKQVIIEDDEYVSSHELLNSLCHKIIREGKFNTKFNIIYKIVKTYVRDICFGQKVDLDKLVVRKNLAKANVSDSITIYLSRKLGEFTKVSTKMTMKNYPISLMELEGFYWKRDIAEAKRTVFKYTPVYNNLERDFAIFLEEAKDINKFAALAETYTKFCITYLNRKGSQSLYYPDFVAEQELTDGSRINWIIETKGFEDDNVALKDAEAKNWCKNATEFTDDTWKFLKVADLTFRKIKPNTFSQLLNGIKNIENEKLNL